tara:strand:+ start:853 stop:1296 length:444 start_codon:yes stop_codon:yes gene_type:complete
MIPELMGGRALEHDIPVEPGKGFAVKGQTALMTALSGATNLLAFKQQAIDMADAAHTLIVTGTAVGAQTRIESNVLYVDANSSGTEILTLPPEPSSTGLLLFLYNSGGESIVVKNDAGSPATICTVATVKGAVLFCDGTTWRSILGA